MDKKAYAVIDADAVRADFMPSLFSLNAAILLISVTIAGNQSTPYTYAGMGLSLQRYVLIITPPT
jgi:hypothetical protein